MTNTTTLFHYSCLLPTFSSNYPPQARFSIIWSKPQCHMVVVREPMHIELYTQSFYNNGKFPPVIMEEWRRSLESWKRTFVFPITMLQFSVLLLFRNPNCLGLLLLPYNSSETWALVNKELLLFSGMTSPAIHLWNKLILKRPCWFFKNLHY